LPVFDSLAAFLLKVSPEAFSAMFIQILVKSFEDFSTVSGKSHLNFWSHPICGTYKKVVNRLCCVLNGIRRNCLLRVDGHMEYTVFGLENKKCRQNS
jgi:hypothetical protein